MPKQAAPDLRPAIHYICYLPPRTGGELVNLQHVAALAKHGVRAVALVNEHATVGELPEDFAVPIEVLAPHRQFSADDVVVIPEFYRDAFRHFASQPCRRVIHLQGPFLAFRGFDSIEQLNADGLSGGLSCSRFGRDLMQRMGARIDWQVVTPFILPFFQSGITPKKLQVAYMPDKRPKEAPVLEALFRARHPDLAGVPWVPISRLSRRECAAVMSESAVFASLSYLEGLGLPPLEAMACACLVGGFDGHGGRDFVTPENGLWVPEGQHEAFADAIATAVRRARDGGPEADRQRAAGLATAALYSRQRFESELLAAWQTLLGPRWEAYLQR